MRLALALLLLVLLLATPVSAETLRLQTEEHHIAIGGVIAHVGISNGVQASYAIDGGIVVPVTPSDVRITDRRATLRLPDRTLVCPLPVEALHEDRARLLTRDGRTTRVLERLHRRTWELDCPDGPAVIWDVSDTTTITTKGP